MTAHSRKIAIALPFGPIARPSRVAPGTDAQNQPEPDDGSQLAAAAQAEYAARRRRDRLFNAHIFAEPAWDMLLDLYIQRHRERSVSIHSLCIAAAVPQTTALRWIGKLETRGFVGRQPSQHDNRVIHIVLSAAGLDLMKRYLRGQVGEGAGAAAALSFN